MRTEIREGVGYWGRVCALSAMRIASSVECPELRVESLEPILFKAEDSLSALDPCLLILLFWLLSLSSRLLALFHSVKC